MRSILDDKSKNRSKTFWIQHEGQMGPPSEDKQGTEAQ